MRDVSRKIDTLRTATAQSLVKVGPTGLQHLRNGTLPKGEPFGICEAAGMLGAKQTAALIPHCHNLPLDNLEVRCELTDEGVAITAQARTVWKTGVEMEALTAVSIAALTLYDLLKPVEEQVTIAETKIIDKRGGTSQFAQLFRDIRPRFAILVASDRASEGTYEDASGKRIGEILGEYGGQPAGYVVMPDEQSALQQQLQDWCQAGTVDFIFTTGGTGIAPRDVMVEATARVIEREVPGVAEAMRTYSQRRKPLAMFSRGLVGVRGRTMIVNLPGSPKGVEECLDTLLPYIFHAVSELAKGPAPVAGPADSGTEMPHAVPMGAMQEPMVIPQPEPALSTPVANIPVVAPPPPEPAPQPRFDPLTGQPLMATPATGTQPVAVAPSLEQTPPGQPHLNPGWRGTQVVSPVTPVDQPAVPRFDPVTGAPLGYGPPPEAEPKLDDTASFNMPPP